MSFQHNASVIVFCHLDKNCRRKKNMSVWSFFVTSIKKRSRGQDHESKRQKYMTGQSKLLRPKRSSLFYWWLLSRIEEKPKKSWKKKTSRFASVKLGFPQSAKRMGVFDSTKHLLPSRWTFSAGGQNQVKKSLASTARVSSRRRTVLGKKITCFHRERLSTEEISTCIGTSIFLFEKQRTNW